MAPRRPLREQGRDTLLACRTWTQLHKEGIPVYLDKAFPEDEDYVYGGGKIRQSPNRVFDVQKHWWGWNVVRLGYNAVCTSWDVGGGSLL